MLNVQAAAQAYIDSHKTGGKVWPNDAEFAVCYYLSTWPMGWLRESSMEFFTCRADLDTWIADKCEWAKCEDNYVAYQVYEWDLGPNKIGGWINAGGQSEVAAPYLN